METATRTVTEEARASLVERISAMHRLWDLLTADLTAEHVNHFERSGVLPIAFSLAHAVISEDRSMHQLFGTGVVWDAHAERVGLSGDVPKRGTPMEVAERTRIRDVEAWRAYQRAVFERAQREIAEAPLKRLAAPYEIPARAFAGGFLALLVGTPERVRVIDALEAWIYQHGIRHAGELEHARALVGLKGIA